jgi:hypothetical protein
MSSEMEQRRQAMDLLYRKIDRARGAWRALEALDGLLRAVLVCGAGLMAALVADNLMHLPAGVRLACALVLLGALAAMLARGVLYPLLRTITDEMVAAHVERAFPELDNRLINAVLLSGERFRDSLTRLMVTWHLRQTADKVQGRDLARSGQARGLWKPGRWALALAGGLVLYALLFPPYLGNALARLVRPYSLIPPITDTRLEVRPGNADVLQGDTLSVEARVSGLVPEGARIYADAPGGQRTSDSMTFEGNAFAYVFSNVQEDFRYHIRAGDALTPRYTVTVRRRPMITGLTVTYTYPEYTALPERTESGANGDIRAPVGTRARIAVQADRPVPNGQIQLTFLAPEQEGAPASLTVPLLASGPAALWGQLPVERSGRYQIVVTDQAGVQNLPQVRRVEAVPDAAPRVEFVKPGKDVAVDARARVALLASAEDDLGLRELHLFVQRASGAEWEKLRSWAYEPGTRLAREGAVLDVQELGVPVGGSIAYYMQASDGLRREGEDVGRSRVYHVRVASAEAAGEAEESARGALNDVIKSLIELQKANLKGTQELAVWARGLEGLARQEDEGWAAFRDRGAPLVVAQESICQQASQTASAYAGEGAASMVEALGKIAAGPMMQAAALLRELRALNDAAEVEPRAQAAQQVEVQVIALLEQLLENPAAALASLLRRERAAEELAKSGEAPSGRELAQKLLRALTEFATDQKNVVELSNQLARKAVEDFTSGDEKALADIVDKEREWTKFFQEAATDLSKLPPQDFSLATQAKEFLEVYSEVQQAAQEGERKQIELAVPYEQAGLELARQIETNIEKWLMETKDNILWSMEDPMQDYEVPMAELPNELQDLIGDLVENEQDMEEQFDDVTSGWFDSLDLGAGWDAMDGPISNMSAKGVTGNRLPNTQEIGGRSGEGRTGKSSGQFVEEEATGKGGRQTPSRLTPDPFESGSVRDLSGEAAGGATGGGKVSGQGAEGFRGPVPPPLLQELRRMAARQQDLIDKAQRLDYGLKKYRQPRGSLPQTIELMAAQKARLESGDLSNFAGSQRIVLSNLREVKELSEKQKQLWRDHSALLPKQLRDEIAAAQNEMVPDRYRAMVQNYFRALSEAGTPRR